MTRDTRNASAARIAITLGTAVAAVMLVIWAASALAGAMTGGLRPAPALKSVTTRVEAQPAVVATDVVSAAVTATAEAAEPAPVVKPPAKAVPVAPRPQTSAGSYVVVIDPGHQAKGDPRLEPVGPGSSTKKARNTSGASGAYTRQPESMLNLQVALKIRDILASRGVKVIMCRTTQDVVISNAERARQANTAKADLFLRVHADGVEDRSQNGFMTMVPAANQWWGGSLLSTSERAGGFVQRATIAATGAKDRGITHRGDMTGFNWAKVPSVLVEMGFLSNEKEDRAMATSAYQQKLALGISNGVMDYLRSSR